MKRCYKNKCNKKNGVIHENRRKGGIFSTLKGREGTPSDCIFPFLMAGRHKVEKWLPGLSTCKGDFCWECLTTEIQANKTGFKPYLSDCIFCLAWLWWFTLQSCLRLNSHVLSSPTRCSASSESYLYHSCKPILDQEN